MSGRLRQVLLYTQQAIYIYAYKCLCQCVGKVYYPNVICVYCSLICFGPSFQKMTHHFLLHGSLWPTNLEKIRSPGRVLSRIMLYIKLRPKSCPTFIVLIFLFWYIRKTVGSRENPYCLLFFYCNEIPNS